MKITRCANAGIILEIDNISILLDGVCQKLDPYYETPQCVKDDILKNIPDLVAFTHKHPDHYDEEFENAIKDKTILLTPDNARQIKVCGVEVKPIETRHIGVYKIEHTSFVIKGSRCVWFLGDASPLGIKKMEDAPDVICAPFAYANTEFSFNGLKKYGAKQIIILHMPIEEKDTLNTMQTVKEVVKDDSSVCILQMGQTIEIN